MMNFSTIRSTTVLVTVLLMSLVFWEQPAAASEGTKIRRFAFSVGANEGGAGRATLRFAESDAKAFTSVMSELGGVKQRDSVLILNSNKQHILNGFTQIRSLLKKAQKPNVRLELLFYYSGHSDEKGLLLSGESITYKEIKKEIKSMPADVRIAVLDSCASGTLTRTKGGTRTSSFLMDESTKVTGYALLTSSSADEAAQESDKVGGSFFTHYLVSGLRGGADASRDGRVTLNEAYTYAFNETLARTESTQAGPQHPNYDFRLSGAGDLVLTDLRGTSAVLVLSADMSGRVYVRDKNGTLVAEINKPNRRPVKLGLDPGKYEVTLEANGMVKRGFVNVPRKGSARLTTIAMANVDTEKTVLRGGKSDTPPQKDKNEKVYEDGAVGFFPGFTTDGPNAPNTVNKIAFNFFGGGGHLEGVEVGFPGNLRLKSARGVQLALAYNWTGTLNGAQFSHVNMASKHARGLQWGMVNYAYSMEGVQASLVNGSIDYFKGWQGGLVNYAGEFQGAQTGLVQIIPGDTRGLQLGLFNYGGTLQGMQWGLLNIVPFDVNGAQFSLLNTAGQMRGLQMGLVNVSAGKMHGTQIGLFNFAKEMHGPQIGIFNFSSNGLFALSYWGTDTAPINIGIKAGNPYTYSVFGVSFNPTEENQLSSSFWGFGGHIEFHPFWIDIDAVSHTLYNDYDWSTNDLDMLIKFRPTLGFRLAQQLSIFAGPVLNILISEKRDNIGLGAEFGKWTSDGGVTTQLSPGFVAGIQWEPTFGKLNTYRTDPQLDE